jgi:hypothetical protein
MQDQSAHSKIAEFLDKKTNGVVDENPFYLFEPYDVGKRPEWVLEQARKDGIDLYTDEMLTHIGADPHRFQTGFLLSTAPFRTVIAGSRNGKTCIDLVELAIMVSGEKPISMRVEKGVKTGFKRKISKENIARFGRFDIRSGAFIDHDINAQRPEGWEEWDCGYIVGAGIYPDEKIPKPGETLWIGCTQRALTERWWPAFENEEDDDVFPKEFIDRKRGYNGYMKSENVVFGVRRMRVALISYESGFRKFEAAGKEAIGIWAVFFDEEPPDQACVTAAVTRCKYFSLSETPYLGITYTKGLIFNPKKDKRKNQVFHATIYDSPYMDKETIDHRRSLYPVHEIGARIWGLHTELKGKPYFDRTKINAWIRANKIPFELGRFRAFEEYDGMYSRPDHEKPGLFSVDILLETKATVENQQDVWRIYEKRKDDTAYFLMADSSEGSDVPIESGDVLASLVMRPPVGDEMFPQIVASLRSTLKTVYFARVCSWALRYFNNALLCAEGPTRGSFNAIFYAELDDYPYWYNQPSERWSTRKYRTVKGFDTNVATRPAIFDSITEVLSEYDILDIPEIRDVPLLKELAACILATKNGKLRPDHPTDGSLDTAICYGQGLYVWKHNPEQIRCRAEIRRPDQHRFGELVAERTKPEKPPVYLGEGQSSLR